MEIFHKKKKRKCVKKKWGYLDWAIERKKKVERRRIQSNKGTPEVVKDEEDGLQSNHSGSINSRLLLCTVSLQIVNYLGSPQMPIPCSS